MPTIVFRAVSGNVIGVVEKPDVFDPTKSPAEQHVVKIGVLDRKGPMPKKDIHIIIQELLRFAKTL